MRPIYPGQFHSVRRNTWNLVFVLDLASVPSLDVIATTASTLIQRGVPFRFGFVPMTTPGVDDMCTYQACGHSGSANVLIDTASKMAKVFLYIVKAFGRGRTRDFLQEVGHMY
jgi:UDP-glucose:glycoprotein glucosyltransferase